jgi:hypothetical protein
MGSLILILFKTPQELNVDVPGKETTKIDPKKSQTTLKMTELWKIP